MISEKVFEDILCKYPNLIENQLKLIDRQVTLYGRRIDILFEDQFKRKLIVELKAGPIKDGHIGQILSYEGMLLSDDDPSIRVMLIGTRVPPNLQKSLDHHGIAWKEIPISKLIEFLRKVGDEQLLACFNTLDSSTPLPNETKKINMSPTIRQNPSNKPKLTGATTFKDLCDIIRILSNTVPTNYMDLLFLENENKTLSGILAQWQNYEGKNRDFKTISVIRRHINWREKHNGWIFNQSGDSKNPIVKLVGLKGRP